MTIHTATTRHLIDVTVCEDGDEGIEPGVLQSIIESALLSSGIEVLSLDVSPDIGLGAEDVAFFDEQGEDGLYFPVGGASLRVSSAEANNEEPYVDRNRGVEPLMRF